MTPTLAAALLLAFEPFRLLMEIEPKKTSRNANRKASNPAGGNISKPN
jgi:hypothetical protein